VRCGADDLQGRARLRRSISAELHAILMPQAPVPAAQAAPEAAYQANQGHRRPLQ
jgi:hypothetical protein